MLLHTPIGARCAGAVDAGRPAIAPGNFDAEVYGALRRLYLRHSIERAALRLYVEQLSTFEADRVPILPLLLTVAELADLFGAHDVFYVLLAISRGCPLLTCDRGLARAAARLGVTVVIPDGSSHA